MSFIVVPYFWELSPADSWLTIITECVWGAPPWSLPPSSLPVWRCLSMAFCPLPHAGGIFFSLVEILELKLLETWPRRSSPSQTFYQSCKAGLSLQCSCQSSRLHTHLCCWGSVTWHETPLLCLSKKACSFPALSFSLCGVEVLLSKFLTYRIRNHKPHCGRFRTQETVMKIV